MVRVEIARTWDYQSARIGAEARVEIGENEDSGEVYRKTRRWLGAQCRQGATEELSKMFAEAGKERQG